MAEARLYLGSAVGDDNRVEYDQDNFTTHGVIVGMTGSGKTGLGVGLIEEALLNGIPCLVLDPKGDMGNLALNFPDFAPADFLPWMDQGKAKAEDMTVDQLAESTAKKWQEGLEGAGLGPEQMRQLTDNTKVTIYTPGSTAGVPLNVLGSLQAPDADWSTQAEVLRDEIESFVSSLLVMADIEADPVSDPAHILLATIIEKFWSEGRDLDLATLVGQVPKPPMRKLGVFNIDDFFPEKERMALAMKLNGLLASPSFATWLEGVPLDIEAMIAGGDRTNAAVVYMAHLTETERQFVVTLLLSKFITWMRSQSGSSTLRSLIYMDEVFGFVPPTAEPPSKKPILTILKQARAFGAGMVLSTQNPIDLDYKAMSNAGTWMVGRLQTENDKKRILEGLDSAGATVDTGEYDRLISGLDKRQFLLHSTKQEPVVFSTRWVMSYLAGPLTRDQVATLTESDRSATPPTSTQPIVETRVDDDAAVPVAPPVAEGVTSTYLDPAAAWGPTVGADPAGTRYRAGAALRIQLLYDETKADLSHSEEYEAIVFPLDALISDETVFAVDHDTRDFLQQPTGGTSSFDIPDAKIQNKTFWTSLQTQIKSHLVANRKVTIYTNSDLGLYSRVGEDEAAFTARCTAAAADAKEQAMAKLEDKYKTRIDRARATISKSENRVRELEAEASSKGTEELLTGAGALFGALFGGKSSSTSIERAARRRSATSRAKSRAEAAGEALADDLADLEDLESELADEITELADEFDQKASQVETFEIPLEKTDITVGEVKLVWIPVL